uniref:Uncharacterized protein n=1 Tax=Pseudictyota dubia TaxID=2749911 RepID=A0A7R9VUM0_9STRA
MRGEDDHTLSIASEELREGTHCDMNKELSVPSLAAVLNFVSGTDSGPSSAPFTIEQRMLPQCAGTSLAPGAFRADALSLSISTSAVAIGDGSQPPVNVSLSLIS